MKKVLLILLMILIPIGMSSAQETMKLHLSFSKKQFAFSFDSTNVLKIEPGDAEFVSTYGCDANEPCLPWVTVNVSVPHGMLLGSLTHSASKTLIFKNVSVAANPVVVPTNELDAAPVKTILNYLSPEYPSEQVRYIMSSTLDGSTTMHLQVCPFKYDALSRNLYLLNDIDIDINMKTDASAHSDGNESFAKFCAEKKINFDAVASAYSVPSRFEGIGDSIDYLIITSKEFAPYFQPFVHWKITKGVRTSITTIEDIKSMDAGSSRSLPDMIKAYLMYMYHMKGYRFKYLLLGGDDSVVPSKKCYGYVSGTDQKEMVPTDIYYACLNYSKDPFWDSSHNGVSGEIEDSVDFSQTIYVSRLPVNTSTEVKMALMKFMLYEQTPSINGWNNSILMSGCKLSENNEVDKHSDAEHVGDLLYSKIIRRYWNGERVKFYDTYSDLQNDGIYTFTPSNLVKSLSKGYAFIDMITHGNYTWWNMPNGCYDEAMAANMTSKQYSVITTIACRTNGFDMAEPCLSEAFIRNPNNGVIAYLGSSRAGWYYKGLSSGPSSQYEEAFYKYLFSDNLKDKNFGKVVAYAKNSKLADCSEYNCARWLLYNLNPIGDPEMPIYTTTPQTFANCSVKESEGKVYVITGEGNCKVCVMSSDDYGKTYYKVYNDISLIAFNKRDENLTICITKQNYIPKKFEIKAASPGKANAKISSVVNTDSKLLVEMLIGNDVKDAVLRVSSAEGNRVNSYKVSCDSPSVEVDVSAMKSGVCVLSLVTDGTVADTKQVIRK